MRQARMEVARTEAHGAELAMVAAERDLGQAASEITRAEQRVQQIADEQQRIRESIRKIAAEESDAKNAIEVSRQSSAEATQALASFEGVYAERRQAVDAQNERMSELRVAATQATERSERDRAAHQRVQQSLELLVERETRLIGDACDARVLYGRTMGRALLFSGRLGESVQDALESKDLVQTTKERFDQSEQIVGDAEVALRQIRNQIDSMGDELNKLSLRDQELNLASTHLLEQIDDRYHEDLRFVLIEYHARPEPDASVEDRVDELHRLISRMGEINLTAIDEFDEKSTRYEYLSGQRTDLDNALKQLDSAIRKMNRESRTLFREAFDGINERFKRIFPLLFRGGKAELLLSDPQDMLETGIDIAAQPPGKKLGSLELMSGGEKALTAVAMIFAIFQYKPSPFCLLDEVDAPLDEANVARFAESIRQMTDRSQFIVITHSKRTMEFADSLYGVTMEQPGISKLVNVELRGNKRPVAAPAGETAAA
ncbi:MAG: AAA family ATPase [Polyangiales bacterium]